MYPVYPVNVPLNNPLWLLVVTPTKTLLKSVHVSVSTTSLRAIVISLFA